MNSLIFPNLPNLRRSGLLAGLLAILFVTAPLEATQPQLRGLGPAPRTDNGRFTNLNGELSHAGFGTRFPFFLRRIGGAFRSRPGAPERVENDGVFLRENAGHSIPTITWIGHSTFLVQMDHATFLTDPIWSDTPSPIAFAGPRRFVPPGLDLEDLPAIDFVIISHNHYDHLDLPTLRALAERDPETRFFVPLGNAALLLDEGISAVEELDWGSTVKHEGVEVHCLPSQHWSKRGLGDNLKTLWASWAVTGAERRFYFAGDTGYFDGFSRIGNALGPFDLAAVPIGAYEPVEMMQASHLNPEEALRAAIDVGGRRAVAMHFGTFDLSDEALEDPPRRFLEAAASSPIGIAGAWVLKVGETRPF